jgi:hypothetical protein
MRQEPVDTPNAGGGRRRTQKKETASKEVIDKVDAQGGSEETAQVKAQGLNAYSIRDALEFGKPYTPIEDRNAFYRFSPEGLFLTVPVRDETIKAQLIPTYHYIAWGWDWAKDGTVTTPIDPMTGIPFNASTYAALSYDPTTPWTGTSWEKYHGGRLFYALTNYIRSNQMFSEADIIKIVKAIIGYEMMGWAMMTCYIYWRANLWPILDTSVRKLVLSSSEGDPLYSSISDLMSGINLQTQVNFFPWPVLNFWIPRGLFALSKQTPWNKYLMFVPDAGTTFARSGIAMLNDAYTTTQVWKHPQTYLQENDLWDAFRDKLVPLLWGKQSFESYTGKGLLTYLEDVGYKPIVHDFDWYNWLTQKFWVHPFDETAGIGIRKLPKRAAQAEDAIKTMNDYYFSGSEESSEGNVFYIPDTSFVGPKSLYSPWLDIMRFHGIMDNYAANNDAGGANNCQCLSLIVGSSTIELDYNTWYSFFPKYAFEFTKLELVEPEADVALHAEGQNWAEMRMQGRKFCFPFKLPQRHWYTSKTQFKWLYASYLGLDLRDVELFKVQRPSGWNNSGVTTNPTTQ